MVGTHDTKPLTAVVEELVPDARKDRRVVSGGTDGASVEEREEISSTSSGHAQAETRMCKEMFAARTTRRQICSPARPRRTCQIFLADSLGMKEGYNQPGAATVNDTNNGR